MPPKLIARNADRQGGVLPVSAAARANPSRASSSRLKLEIRRLPPGLTQPEFEEIVGDAWKVGNGKVDWLEFRPGKTRAPGSGKLPEQSRCYLHVLNDACVRDLEKRFLEVVFNDKAGTHKSPDLKNLQPTIGFAANQRTPLQQAKPRTDTRQGTIDQDPEFIAFLERETQPITKPAALDSASLEKDGEKKEVKTTPLIEDLREKKANKAKTAQAKAEKAEKEKKSQTVKAPSKEAPTVEKDSSKVTAQQQKVEQAAKDAAKALNKQAVTKQQQQTQAQAQQGKMTVSAKPKRPPASPKPQTTAPAATPSATPASTTPSPASQRVPPSQRQRGNTDGIKKMLQKDLGIKPKSSPTAPLSTTPASTSTPTSPATTSISTDPKPPSTPAASRSSPVPPTSELKALPIKAYLKHANPSQGMTEILIQQALSSYGEVTNVTIDPRKGTAIAVFKQNEGLTSALEAKRVPVANGAVEVLEFRDRLPSGAASRGGFRGGRGGRGGGRGGAQAGDTSTPAAVTPAPAASTQAS